MTFPSNFFFLYIYSLRHELLQFLFMHVYLSRCSLTHNRHSRFEEKLAMSDFPNIDNFQITIFIKHISSLNISDMTQFCTKFYHSWDWCKSALKVFVNIVSWGMVKTQVEWKNRTWHNFMSTESLILSVIAEHNLAIFNVSS